MKLANSWTKTARATAAALTLAVSLDALAASGSAAGTLTLKSKGTPITVALKYVWLVKSPDAMDRVAASRPRV